MIAYSYPILGAFWTMLEFFLFFIWIYLLIIIFADIFRSHDLGGLAKALWVLFVIVVPYLGAFVYLIARGGSMHERSVKQAQAQQQAFQNYVRETAGTGNSTTDELARLATLRDQGKITEADFEKGKAKILD